MAERARRWDAPGRKWFGAWATANRILPLATFIFAAIQLPFLFYPLRDLLREQPSPARLLPALVGMVVLVAAYVWLLAHDPFPVEPVALAHRRTDFALLAVLVTDVCFLTLVYSADWLWFLIYASIAAGVTLPARGAIWVVVGLMLLALGAGRLVLDWVYAARTLLPVGSLGLGAIVVTTLVNTIRELRAAREEIARLAVAEERLRFARDLHDLLGRSLSTITLKNELARRLVRADPDRAACELADAVAVAREALREVREAVGGYRQPTLASELASAREILAAAGIAHRCEQTAGPLPPAVEAALAWTVREGVTNVVRHSRAQHCTIQVALTAGAASAEVTDDGRGDIPAPDGGVENVAGNGLRGLAERVAQQHGQIEAGPCATGGFRLRVVLPVAGVAPPPDAAQEEVR